MFGSLNLVLSTNKIKSLENKSIEAAEAGENDAAWQALQPLLRAQHHQEEAATALLRIVKQCDLPADKALDVLAAIHKAYAEHEKLLCLIGGCIEKARDLDFLNAPPPDHPLFSNLVGGLAKIVDDATDSAIEEKALSGLAGAARMQARQHDELAEKSYKRMIELDPNDSAYHYNYGLFLKTRGRFEEGVQANQAAARLAEKPVDSNEWNLGICASGAGQGATALDVWKRMGQKIEMGRFDLPDGGYPQCKVRLAERPLAERTADHDDPGREETIWIERLSPCHGIIRSVLFQDNLGVDYGDVVLIDGAPITYHTYGDEQIPVFPHLATLRRQGYQYFDFTGTQDTTRRLADISAALDGDAIVYSHTENYRNLCANCWRDPDLQHEHAETLEKHVVTGRIAAPRDRDARQLLDQLDAAIAERSPCTLYAPDLCVAAGLEDRAAVEQRRFDLLKNN